MAISTASSPYRLAFESALELLSQQETGALTQPPRRTTPWVDTLLALPETERFAALAAGELPIQPDLVARLLDRSRRVLARFPDTADHLARLALAAAQGLDARSFPQVLILDQQADCWAQLALARLGQGQILAARLALATAECLLPAGSGDPLTQAAVSTARAELLAKTGELTASLELLDQVLELYAVIDDPHLLGTALFRRGLVHRRLRNVEGARRDLSAALYLLDDAREPELRDHCQIALDTLADTLLGRDFDGADGLPN